MCGLLHHHGNCDKVGTVHAIGSRQMFRACVCAAYVTVKIYYNGIVIKLSGFLTRLYKVI